MANISTNEFKGGVKIMLDGEPCNILENEYVKPGKGQAFNRVKLKKLISGKTLEKTFKSGEKLDLADVEEKKLRLLYTEPDAAVFMDDESFEQENIPLSLIGSNQQWLMEEVLYDILYYMILEDV